MAAGGDHDAAAGPLAGARARLRVSVPPSSGLSVMPLGPSLRMTCTAAWSPRVAARMLLPARRAETSAVEAAAR
jgi:hypothetical protein